MKILIVKLGALGDVINTLPAVILIRRHFNAEIHWLVAPLSLPLVAAHPAVDRTIVFDRRAENSLRSCLKNLRRYRYDLAIDFQRTLKSGLFCLAARSRKRLGFDRQRCKEMTWLLPFTRILQGDAGAHMLEQYLDFCRYLGAPTRPVSWQIPLQEKNIPDLPRDYVVLNIGATKPANLWPAVHFAELAALFLTRTELTPILTGGPEDRPRAEAIRQKISQAIVDMTGRTTLSELCRLLAGARAVITCDTGPMHLAVALGTPTLGLFGPSNPRRTGPYQGTVIRSTTPCAPCNRKTCPDPFCMTEILPPQVFERCMEHVNVDGGA